MKHSSFLRAILSAAVPLVCLACSGGKNPVTDDVEPPDITLGSSIPLSGIDTTGAISFEWSGESDMEEYRISIDGNSWSQWSSKRSCFNYFDDGEHKFELQSRVIGSRLSTIDSLRFTVNALKGPALYLYPRICRVEADSIRVTVMVKEMLRLRTMKLVLEGGSLRSVTPRMEGETDLVLLHDETTINLGVGPGALPIEADMAVADLTIAVDTTADTCSIDIAECILRDTLHSDISTGTVRGAMAVSTETTWGN